MFACTSDMCIKLLLIYLLAYIPGHVKRYIVVYLLSSAENSWA